MLIFQLHLQFRFFRI